ncbi:MAG: Fis family transcriptional regulator [Psychrobium sp.]|nr:Fis family transcriptional regulator [Psychrobium sp.]
MKKSDKKIANALRKALTYVCEELEDSVEGFSWLTDEVNYDQYPKSLVVILMFETSEMATAAKSEQAPFIHSTLEKYLTPLDPKFKQHKPRVVFKAL